MVKRQPTVFVSSTVYDFHDLRSALKYHLEQLGFAVQMSEHADFEKPIEQNTYEACFAAIRDADAFLLLVGGRRGGWYDRTNGISITQAEYQVAYSEARRRNMPVIACVRQTIWDQVACIAELETVGGIVQHQPTKFIEDPVHLRRFLNEIRRVDEMKAAAAADQSPPRANWIHVFANYSDLLDVVRIALRVRRGVAAQLLVEQACDELVAYCGQFLEQSADGAISYFDRLPYLLESLDITTARFVRDPSAPIVLSREQVALLSAICMAACIHSRHPLPALEGVTVSPMLAQYNAATQALSEGPLQRACRRTLLAIRTAEDRENGARTARAALLDEAAGSRHSENWELRAGTILSSVGHALDTARALAEAENVIANVRHRAPLLVAGGAE